MTDLQPHNVDPETGEKRDGSRSEDTGSSTEEDDTGRDVGVFRVGGKYNWCTVAVGVTVSQEQLSVSAVRRLMNWTGNSPPCKVSLSMTAMHMVLHVCLYELMKFFGLLHDFMNW